MYYDATSLTLGSVFPTTSTMLFYTAGVSYTLGCMSFLEYMGFVLVVFPLKCDFIIVQVYIYLLIGGSRMLAVPMEFGCTPGSHYVFTYLTS